MLGKFKNVFRKSKNGVVIKMGRVYECLRCKKEIKPKTPRISVRPSGGRTVFHFHSDCYWNVGRNDDADRLILEEIRKKAISLSEENRKGL